jgi:hypothetical protein
LPATVSTSKPNLQPEQDLNFIYWHLTSKSNLSSNVGSWAGEARLSVEILPIFGEPSAAIEPSDGPLDQRPYNVAKRHSRRSPTESMVPRTQVGEAANKIKVSQQAALDDRHCPCAKRHHPGRISHIKQSL